MCSCDGKAVLIPVFSVIWSFRNHSNMLIWCTRNIIIYAENSCADFLKTMIQIFQDWLMNKNFKKKSIYLKYFFCNVIYLLYIYIFSNSKQTPAQPVAVRSCNSQFRVRICKYCYVVWMHNDFINNSLFLPLPPFPTLFLTTATTPRVTPAAYPKSLPCDRHKTNCRSENVLIKSVEKWNIFVGW